MDHASIDTTMNICAQVFGDDSEDKKLADRIDELSESGGPPHRDPAAPC